MAKQAKYTKRGTLRLTSTERSAAIKQGRAKRTKYTKNGTVRLTKAERSEVMKRAWVSRRARTGMAPAKPAGVPDPVRSAALKRSWQRRRRQGLAVKTAKRVLLTPAERSAIAKAAAAGRIERRALREAEQAAAAAAEVRRAKRTARKAAKVGKPPVKAPARKSLASQRKVELVGTMAAA